jgi:extradiol dioxygenase family protein
MSLSRYRVGAAAAVSDMARARDFYEGKLGLEVGTDSGDNVAYQCGEATFFHVYLSPNHAGKSTATFEGNAKVAYFKDPDGNTLSIAQGPR